MAINIPDDFEGPTAGTFETSGGANDRGGSFALPAGTTVKADQLTEGPERFKIQIRLGGPDGPVVAEQTVTVGDTSQTFYTLTPSLPVAYRNFPVDFTFTTTGPIGTGKFYWEDVGSLSAESFSPASKTGQFTVTDTGTGVKSGTFTRTALSSAADGDMVIRIYTQNPAQEPPADPPPAALQNGGTVLSNIVSLGPVLDPNAFIIQVDTRLTSTQNGSNQTINSETGSTAFRFRNFGTFTIDWGDGTAPVTYTNRDNTSTEVTRDYGAGNGGVYVIQVRNWTANSSGRGPHLGENPLSGNTTLYPTDKIKILKIMRWGTTQWADCAYMFRYATNMTGVYSDAPNLGGNVRDLSWMFAHCLAFNGSPNASMNAWNVSNVNTMRNMFEQARSFNQSIGNWVLTGGNGGPNMQSMFQGAVAFNQPMFASYVGYSRTKLSMFNGANAFNQYLGDWSFLGDGSRTPFLGISTGSPGLGMSVENYSRSLISWANKIRGGASPNGLGSSINASGRRYNNTNYGYINGTHFNNAASARAYLVTSISWIQSTSIMWNSRHHWGAGWSISGDAFTSET